jgi:hypothetical protein
MKLALPLAFVALSLFAASANAQYSDEYDGYHPSREWFALSLGAGAYTPNVGNDSFRQIFGSEKGPLVTGGVDFRVFRIGDIAVLTAGAHMAWARYSASACAVTTAGLDCDNRVDETSMLRLFPLSVLGGLTVDGLARKYRIPFYFTGRLGLDSVFYGTRTGGERDAAGVSFGLRWEAEVALELDFIDRRSQRSLDDEWGINHTYLFARILGSTAASQLPVGTKFAWAAGLGFVF